MLLTNCGITAVSRLCAGTYLSGNNMHTNLTGSNVKAGHDQPCVKFDKMSSRRPVSSKSSTKKPLQEDPAVLLLNVIFEQSDLGLSNPLKEAPETVETMRRLTSASPSSNRPLSARPQSPGMARPFSAKPTSARPTSTRPTSSVSRAGSQAGADTLQPAVFALQDSVQDSKLQSDQQLLCSTIPEGSAAIEAPPSAGLDQDDIRAVEDYLRTYSSTSYGRPLSAPVVPPPRQPYPLTYISHDKWEKFNSSGLKTTVTGCGWSKISRQQDCLRIRAMGMNEVMIPPGSGRRLDPPSELPAPSQDPKLDVQAHTPRAPDFTLPRNRVDISEELLAMKRRISGQKARP